MLKKTAGVLKFLMNYFSGLALESDASTVGAADAQDMAAPTKDLLAEFLQHRPKTLESTLEVLALEIFERLRLRALNIERIDHDKERLYDMIQRVSRAVLYRSRDTRDELTLHLEIFGLEKERREQEVETWRDIVKVLDRLLYIFQLREEAKQRMKFIGNVG